MSAAGMPDGSYQLGSLTVQVKDSIARTAEGGLAGSTLTLARAVSNYSRVSGSPVSALRAATVNPARAYGLELPELSLENHVLIAL
jgi:N-acetylglucosamine-6-phosphate deacetylase